MEQEPTVGDIVHVIRQGRCIAGMVVDVIDGLVEVQEFRPRSYSGPQVIGQTPAPDGQPYVALASARPTSGWHWRNEH